MKSKVMYLDENNDLLQGDLLVLKDNSLVVIFHHKIDDNEFSGTVLSFHKDYRIGEFVENFSIHLFEKFHGTIELSN